MITSCDGQLRNEESDIGLNVEQGKEEEINIEEGREEANTVHETEVFCSP